MTILQNLKPTKSVDLDLTRDPLFKGVIQPMAMGDLYRAAHENNPDIGDPDLVDKATQVDNSEFLPEPENGLELLAKVSAMLEERIKSEISSHTNECRKKKKKKENST